MKRRFLISLCFLVPLFYIAMGHMMGWPLPQLLHDSRNALAFAFIQFLLVLPIMYVNDKYYRVGFKTLLHGAPNMDSLIAVGSIAAVVYGIAAIFQIGYGLGHGDMARVEQWSMDLYFESAGMILTLITLGKFLETRSKGKTSQAISRLMDLAPKTAVVLRDGREVELPVEEVAVGDLLLVRPGQSIPVDGVVVEGTSAVDESALTGESLPVDKGPGDKVAAASINKSGSFTFRATRVGDDTTLAQMIALVDEAASSKAPIAKLADKVAGVFVPVVMTIAAVTAVVWLIVTGGGHHPGPYRRRGRAGDLLPLRPGAGHPCGHHGGHRQGGRKRHSHQVGRGPGDPAHHQNHRPGQDGHRHPGHAQGHRPLPLRGHHPGGAAVRGRLPGKALGAPSGPGHRGRGGGAGQSLWSPPRASRPSTARGSRPASRVPDSWRATGP